MSAPMAAHSGGRIAGAVSAAGGLGSFGGIHPERGPEWVHEQAAIVREFTDRPFAIGFITAFLGQTEAFLSAAIEERPAAVCFSFGAPVAGADGAMTRHRGWAVFAQIGHLRRHLELLLDVAARR